MFTKELTVTTPITPDMSEQKIEELRWYTRESFEKRAADLGLTLIDYREIDVPAKELPPKTVGLFPEKTRWIRFVGVGRYSPEVEAILEQRQGIVNE